jgi:hypothetical protein
MSHALPQNFFAVKTQGKQKKEMVSGNSGLIYPSFIVDLFSLCYTDFVFRLKKSMIKRPKIIKIFR